VVLLLTAGATVGVVHGIRSGHAARELFRMLGAGLIQAPAVLALAAAGVALFGLAPRLISAAWLFVMVALLVGQVGGVIGLDQWAMDVSPFTHLPKLGGPVTAQPLLWLGGITALLTVAGFVGFRRRDIGVA
jgi:ABC-2 type transport system permease protein